MPTKDKAKNASLTEGKAWTGALDDVFEHTAAKAKDIDDKAVALLDALQKAGRIDDACTHLKTTLDGIPREGKVLNWKAYIYSLLRAYDSEVYDAMKGSKGSRRKTDKSTSQSAQSGKALNPNAADFVPGQWWGVGGPTGEINSTTPASPTPKEETTA